MVRSNNSSFYPTPPFLISKMVGKIAGYPNRILEPHAGKGDLIDGMSSKHYHNHRPNVSAIEIDPTLQATLRGKGIPVIDSDFLNFSGPDKFDLIIANPPFQNGEKHRLKALDIIYKGQVIFLLNAETLRNPHTNNRRELVRRLEEMGAEIEYIPDAFRSAERKTAVEVALINVQVDRKVEEDLFADATDTSSIPNHKVSDNFEVSTGQSIEELVREYNHVVDLGTETIIAYYRNYGKIGKYLTLRREVPVACGGDERRSLH